ncbi:MAG: FG-GAP repeat protein [Ahniella sp.]|nr:FG-GAP repeat protein [Ahniella sp.]
MADARADSGQGSGQLGHSVATGDVNGDGYADLVSGAFGYDGSGGQNSGRVSLFLGGAAGFNTVADAQLDGTLTDMRAGGAVAVGDVNADGFGDVIVGAPEYSNGSSLEGAVSIYFGGAGAFNTQADVIMEVNQSGANFGHSVAYAGDINGDGFGDILVGAPNFDATLSNEGAMYLYLGGAIVDATADAVLVGGQASAFLGWTVAGAGDLNGDGFADIAGGAIGFDASGASNGGLVRVFFGGASFDTTPDANLLSGQTDGRMGSGLASAGDINGDGFSDLIVGANEFDNGQLNEGRVFIFKGTAGAFPTTADTTLEVDQIDSGFGTSVAGAGDVNGDGFSDVLVGAPEFDVVGSNNEGAVFLYLGRPSGLTITHSVRMAQSQLATRQGFSVALADVNGDGFADPIVGAPSFDGGVSTDEGAVSVYLSNSVGKAVLPQQFSGLATGPIDFWGRSQNASGFTVAMTNISTLGRERSKLELEACPAGVAFGHGSCQKFITPNWVDTTATANGAVVASIASGLALNRVYAWRARALYAPFSVTQSGTTAPANPRRGPWRRMRANANPGDVRVVEFMFRNGFE